MTQQTIKQHALTTQQRLVKLHVAQLKNLKDLELDFGSQSVTAIMGANCCGKTTVLHALACAYKPIAPDDPDYHFSQFFRPNTDSLWKGSDFILNYRERNGNIERGILSQQYTKQTDRWTPRYQSRPMRFTRFIGIKESVPDLEALTLNSMIHYKRDEAHDTLAEKIKDAAGGILNRSYSTLHRVIYYYGMKKSFAVTTTGHTYSGISMSSGEQRVFRILEAVFSAPKYAMILIDEIDLFLHQDALMRLISALEEHCTSQKQQLIFTTHFPPVANLNEQISVVTLHRASVKTIVWSGYSYIALSHIIGKQDRPIAIYVEDDVAEAIVSHVASHLGIRKFVTIGHFGPASNAFALATGFSLACKNLENTLIVLDGDKCSKPAERRSHLQKVFTGDQAEHEKQRKSLVKKIRSFSTHNSCSPEQMLHKMLHTLNLVGLSGAESALLDTAHSVVNVCKKHDFINKIIENTGESRCVALKDLVSLASRSPTWLHYTRIITIWLKNRSASLNLLQK
jgi:ABC-type lipoprotein export system ATPase subunit